MRKVLSLLLSVVSAWVFASCTVNEMENPSDACSVKQELTFEASLAESNVSPATVTKTSATLNDDGSFASILWNPNDQINVFFTAGTSVTSGCFTNKSETDTRTASFSGVIEVFTGTYENPVDDQMFWAIYPYSENNTCNGSTVTFSIPAEQSSPAGSFANGQWPIMARSNGFNLSFYSVCSGIKFKVLNEGVTSVTFTNKDGNAINGTITASWDSSNHPEITGIEGGTNQVVITPQGSSTFQVGEIYFAVVPVITMSQGIEVTFRTANSSCTYVNDSNISFARNKFNTLYNKDTGYEYEAVYSRVDTVPSEGGSYIIVNNGMALRDNGGQMDKIDVSSALSSDKSTINAASINDIESLVWVWNSSDIYPTYGNYTVINGSDYLYISGSLNNGYSLNLGTYGQDKYAVWNYSGRRVVNGGSSTKRYLSYSNGWTVPTSSDTAGDTYLYKYEDFRSEQAISFVIPAPQIDLATGKTYTQTVTGSKTDVTYEITSSSPSDAATINAETGEVTALRKGIITIKATAAGNRSYKPAEASYTLSIIDSNHKDSYYVKVTDGNIEDGTYLIVYESAKYAFNATNTTNYWVAVEPFDDMILATDDLVDAEVEVTAKNGKYFFKTAKGYVYCNNKALAFNSTHDDKCLNSSTAASDGCFKFQNGTNNYYLRYSASNRKFQYGSNDSANTMALYVFDGSAKAPRRLEFANSSVKRFTGDQNFTVTLTGVTSDVIFSSSNTKVATVNQTTGEVTIGITGTTTITASAPETDAYRAGSASYLLTVKEEGAWSLENNYYSDFLDEAWDKYTNTNWSTVSVVEDYCSNSSSNRKDIPAPVTVSWTASSGSGSYTVSIYNDASHTDLEMSQSSTSTSTDIYNLIPNRTYYYTVTRGSSSITSGSFKTEGRRRMMKVSDTYAIGHANNCRDFGGLMTDTGKTIRYNRIFRGSNMDRTTNAEKEYLTGYMNVGLDVDLRNGSASSSGSSENGNGSAYSPFGNTSYGVSYVKGNFTGNINNDFRPSIASACTSMTTIFTNILATIKQGKAAYIHCYVGADRTGYVCILLEAVLGVSAKDCSIDYETTSFSVVGTRTRKGGGNASGIDSYNLINGYRGSNFKEKAYNILIDYGVTDDQIAEFRDLMLE